MLYTKAKAKKTDTLWRCRRRRHRRCPSCNTAAPNPNATEAKMRTRRDTSTTTFRKRKRRRAPSSSSLAALILSYTTTLLLPTSVHAAVVTWTNGPEDKYFCGLKWDDADCARRQNCRSGEDTECEGHDTHGIQCFANTQCDTKFGGAAAWVEGTYSEEAATATEDGEGGSGEPTKGPTPIDFDSLLESGLFQPTRSPIVPGGPTHIPTEYPIGPPPDFIGPSDDPTDHWFCGVGIDDASNKCATHCPNSNECPRGEICYFGTSCDARTHAPSPPPTRRPTGAPTTAGPTMSWPPTMFPTWTFPPTFFPTLPQPTVSPTLKPTGRPTYAPLTEVQSGFFCGTSWTDVTSHCRKRCVSGEDTDCPGSHSCFAFTGCTEEKGWGDDPSQWIPGYDKWGNSIAEIVSSMKESESAQNGDSGDGGGGGRPTGGGGEAADDEPLCREAEVTITADNWPQETTWTIIDTETGNDVIRGDNDDLVPGEPITSKSCLPSWGCYKFTINDAGGDGLCCEHGQGMYRIRYDGEVVANGAAFYDSEEAEFGCEPEETPEPTRNPTKKPPEPAKVSGSSSGGSQYRCVASPLVDAGYVVSERFCDKFVDCYNEYIESGDDWYCAEDESCITAPACGDGGGGASVVAAVPAEPKEAPAQAPTPIVEVVAEPESAPAPVPKPKDYPSKPRPSPSRPLTNTFVSSAPTPMPVNQPTTPKPSDNPTDQPTSAPITNSPTEQPTSASPTESPTEEPSYSPTFGPCGGDPCRVASYCRSRYGFCGPDEHYCTETAIWTSDCPDKTERPTPSPIATTPSPAAGTVSFVDVFPIPSVTSDDVVTPQVVFQKPSGGGKNKPTGGKGPTASSSGSKVNSNTKPGPESTSDSIPSIPVIETAQSPKTHMPTAIPTNLPTPKPTKKEATFHIIDNTLNLPSNNDPNLGHTNLSEDSSGSVIITNSPTLNPTPNPTPNPTYNKAAITQSSPNVDSVVTNSASSDTATNYYFEAESEYSCTGQPCDEDGWCRSRYGSCGPGFIYCNTYSSWKKSCPKAVLGTRPTRTPTPRPTREPTVGSEFVMTLPTTPKPTVQSFPKLPGPTLPTITTESAESVSLEFIISQSASAAKKGSQDMFETSDGDSEDDGLEAKAEEEDDGNDKDEDEEDGEKEDQKANSEESYVGMDEWLDYTVRRNGATTLYSHHSTHIGGSVMLAVMLSSYLSAWFFMIS